MYEVPNTLRNLPVIRTCEGCSVLGKVGRASVFVSLPKPSRQLLSSQGLRFITGTLVSVIMVKRVV